MLSPSDRTVLTETLRPPAGYEIDRVITTTYTLDLVTLLTLPLSFTLLAGDGMKEDGRVDPIALLEALRRHAGRITVFCDAAHIAVPRRGELLFGYLEQSVVEVRAPLGGAFHPKVTVVRYLPKEEDVAWEESEYPGGDAARYRLLCGTRNLTFDRSWDTLLVLEGDLATTRKNAFGRNRPLARFIRALPGMSVHKMPSSRREDIDLIANELLRVEFTPPAGFFDGRDDLAFWPIGLEEGEVWPFESRTDRLLVMSPFTDRTCLGWLSDEAELACVVSRAEELDRLPMCTLDEVQECFTLADAAETEPAQEDQPEANDSDDETEPDGVLAEGAESQLRGLHAKLFVADAGWNATLWTGSANATSAAFTKNVEFLVELHGKKSAVGINAILGEADEAGAAGRQVSLRSMLAPYETPAEPTVLDAVEKRLEELCDRVRQAWVAAEVVAHVCTSDAESSSFEVTLRATKTSAGALPDGVTSEVQPISRLHDPAAPVSDLQGEVASFPGLAVELLSSFFAVTVTARESGKSVTQRFVLNLPLLGAPENRENKLLLAMLSNRERLIRYLLMLLAGPEFGLRALQNEGDGGQWQDAHFSGGFGLPLLEPLLRTLADDPARLADVERLVRDLESSEEGAALLPEDFVEVWGAIRSVHDAMMKEASDVVS